MPKRRAPRPTTTALVEAKPWQESRSIWLAVLSVAVPLVTYAADNALALGLPDRAIPWIALFVFAAGSIRQRFETTQPIGKPGELVPVDGSAIAPAAPDDETTREILALAAATGQHQAALDRMERAIQNLRQDTGSAPRDEDPARISTRQVQPDGTPFRG